MMGKIKDLAHKIHKEITQEDKNDEFDVSEITHILEEAARQGNLSEEILDRYAI